MSAAGVVTNWSEKFSWTSSRRNASRTSGWSSAIRRRAEVASGMAGVRQRDRRSQILCRSAPFVASPHELIPLSATVGDEKWTQLSLNDREHVRAQEPSVWGPT